MLFALLPGLASAQSTGGSFGGGDWGDDDDTGSDHYDPPSSSGSSDYGGSDRSYFDERDRYERDRYERDRYYRDRHYRDDDDYRHVATGIPWLDAVLATLTLLLTLAAFVVPIVLHFTRKRRRRADRPRAGAYHARRTGASREWHAVDVTALHLAIDWRAREYVQRGLDALARSGKTRTASGLVDLLGRTTELLTSARLAWLYADVINHRPMGKKVAQMTFRQLGMNARSGFGSEIIRAQDGALAERGSEALAPSRDGGAFRSLPADVPGVVVVTVIVAAKVELRDVLEPRDAHEVQTLLDRLLAVGQDELVALDVVWSPAAADDILSIAELEELYPSLRRLDESTVGPRVFCPQCAAPYRRDADACPRCGARNDAQEPIG